jgi:molybdopterin-guanine dinucleotide biosynthesis protein A
MGRDKALLVVDGEPMVRRVVAAARAAGAAAVITVGGDQDGLRAALAGHDVRLVPDRFPGEGPLGGVVTALGELDEEVVLAVSCDLLLPDARAMAATVAGLAETSGAEVAVPEVDGRAQWLHAAWRRSAVLERLADRFAAGERSVHRAVAQAGLDVVVLPQVDPAAYADADTPEDLRRST